MLPEGSSEPITSQEICNRLNYIPGHATAPMIREKIRDLIALGVPVGSTNDGYFIIRSQAEFEIYEENLWQRSRKILNRLADLQRAWKTGDSSWEDEQIDDMESLENQGLLFPDAQARDEEG